MVFFLTYINSTKTETVDAMPYATVEDAKKKLAKLPLGYVASWTIRDGNDKIIETGENPN
jgi:hypothetical protein